MPKYWRTELSTVNRQCGVNKKKKSAHSKMFYFSRSEFGPHRLLTQGASFRQYISDILAVWRYSVTCCDLTLVNEWFISDYKLILFQRYCKMRVRVVSIYRPLLHLHFRRLKKKTFKGPWPLKEQKRF
jgi:hypothetical protein